MKKLTKQNLDELAATMNIVPAEEQLGYVGAYSNDCFWRCIAYLRENSTDEAIAEIYAQSYFSRINGTNYYHTNATLQDRGSGMTERDILNYIHQCVSDGSYNSGSPLGYIGMFDNSNITDYKNGPAGRHAVIISHVSNSDGSYNYFDPQGNCSGTISASEMGHISRAMY